MYIAEQGNHRIQKFNSKGNFMTTWGSGGTADGHFNMPRDIAVDSTGHVYVADEGNSRIQAFDIDGNFIAKWGTKGSGDGQFDEPYGVAVDSSGNVYDGAYGYDKFSRTNYANSNLGNCTDPNIPKGFFSNTPMNRRKRSFRPFKEESLCLYSLG